MLALLGGLKAKLIAAGAILLAVLLAVARIFGAGKRAAQVEGMKRQLQNVETRNATDNAVRAADPADRERLRDKWTRD